MRAAVCLAAIACVLTGATARAQQAMEYDYLNTREWQMAQQYVGPAFDACIARSTATDNGQTLTLGRSITGDDFILVHNIGALVAPTDTKIRGRVWINGKTPYEFSEQQVFDSSMKPGQKYASIYLANGFIDQFAKANSVDVEFTFGRSSHSLRGSSNVISKLDRCIDDGLAVERQAATPPPPPPPPAFVAPAGWDVTTPPEGNGIRLIATELPLIAGLAPGTKSYLGIADNGNGRYDLRFRHDPQAMFTRVDLAAAGAKRIAATVGMRGSTPFTTLAALQGDNLDILDVLPADLIKLGTTGFLHVESVDPSTPYKLDIPVLGNTVGGPAAILAPPPAPVQPVSTEPLPITIETLAGKYYVRGRNPNGNLYYGDAEAIVENGMLRVNWSWRNGKSDTGQANLVSNLLTAVVPGFADPVLYTIGKDHTWRGTWAKGTATEVLIPKQ